MVIPAQGCQLCATSGHEWVGELMEILSWRFNHGCGLPPIQSTHGGCHGCGLPPIPPITTTFHPQTTTTPPKAFHPLQPNPRMSLQSQPPTHNHTHPSHPLLSIHKPITNFTHPQQNDTRWQDAVLDQEGNPVCLSSFFLNERPETKHVFKADCVNEDCQ